MRTRRSLSLVHETTHPMSIAEASRYQIVLTYVEYITRTIKEGELCPKWM